MGCKVMTGARAVIWHTSPSCARYLERLECRGDASPDQLAADCHNQVKYAYSMMRLLLNAGVVHVRAWRHNYKGSPTPIYRLGPGKSRPMPKPETTAQRCRRRRKAFIGLWGVEAANKILSSSAVPGRIVRDGKTIMPRDHGSHLAGKVST